MCFVYFENKKPEADENQQAAPRCGCELNLFERIILPATETKLWNLLLSPRCIPCDHFRFLLVNNTECIFFLLLFYMREGVQFVCFSVVDEEKWWWFVISNVLFFHSHTSVCNFQDNKSKKKKSNEKRKGNSHFRRLAWWLRVLGVAKEKKMAELLNWFSQSITSTHTFTHRRIHITKGEYWRREKEIKVYESCQKKTENANFFSFLTLPQRQIENNTIILFVFVFLRGKSFSFPKCQKT